MKKTKKLFALLALSSMVLSGCSLSDVKDWVRSNIVDPVKGLINPEKGGEQKEDEKPSGEDQKHDEGGEQGGEGEHTHTHSFDTYQYDDFDHWKVCSCGETTEKEAHDLQESITTPATCTEDGVKTFSCECGYSFTRPIEATGHRWNDGEITTEPTATSPGVITYTCLDCGETKTEEIGAKVRISEDEEVVLAGFSKVYRLDVLEATLGFSTSIEVSDMALNANVAVKVVDGGDGVFYHPIIGGAEFQWITNEENTGGWANVYETWYKGAGQLDENGKLSVTFEDYLEREFPAGAKLYVAVEPINWIARESAKTYEEGYTVYEIEVLKETGSFVGSIATANNSTEYVGAINVDEGTTWVGIVGYGLDLWYRPEWHEGDWWVGYDTWKEFAATTDENGLISFAVNEYDARFSAGTKIFIALKQAPQVKFTFGESNRAVPGYSKVFELTFTAPSNSIETDEVVGLPGEIIKGAFTILCNDESVYFQPQIGDSQDKFFHSGDSWWVKFGDYTPFNAALDEEGKLNIKINDYQGVQFPSGSTLVLAFNGDNNLGYIVGRSEQVVDGYADVYKIDIVKAINTFTTNIHFGNAGDEVIGKVTVFGIEDDTYFEPQIGDLVGTFWHSGESWWTSYGVYKGFSATLNDSGDLEVKIQDFSGVQFPAGSSIHIAVKAKPTEAFSVYKTSSYKIADFDDVYCIEINFPTNTFTTKIACGEANADVLGKVTVVGLEDNIYYEPQIGNLSGVFWHSGDDWWDSFGELRDFNATLDENGKLDVTIKDFGGAQFPAEAKIYIAVKDANALAPFEVKAVDSPAFGEGYQTYAIEVIGVCSSTFQAKINVGSANASFTGAMTGGGSEAWLNSYVQNSSFDDFKFFHPTTAYGGNWSFLYGEWYEFTVTSDADGNITVENKKYDADTLPVGAIIYVALKAAA